MSTRTDAPPRSTIAFRGGWGTVLNACLFAILALFSGGAAANPVPAYESAQPPVSNSEDSELETVTVEAQRKRELLQEQVNNFVSSITIPAHEALARWQVPICVLVAGLPRSRGEFLLERLSQTAKEAGIPLGPPDCSPNFLVIVTAEPEALLKKWGFDPRLYNRDRGLGGVRRFIDTDQPVRVWHNACDVPPGLAKSFQMKGSPHCGEPGELGSRLTWAVVRSIYSVIVVVDTGYLKGLNERQLADYISMVGLAQLRTNPELGAASTILRLFAATEAERPQGLSTWDQAFLKSLYATKTEDVTQLSQMKHRMGQHLAP